MKISKLLEFLRKTFRSPKRKRLELRYVTYAQADKLLRTGVWQLAPEEDSNRDARFVYLERLEDAVSLPPSE